MLSTNQTINNPLLRVWTGPKTNPARDPGRHGKLVWSLPWSLHPLHRRDHLLGPAWKAIEQPGLVWPPWYQTHTGNGSLGKHKENDLERGSSTFFFREEGFACCLLLLGVAANLCWGLFPHLERKHNLSMEAIFAFCTIYILNIAQGRGACCNKDSSVWL